MDAPKQDSPAFGVELGADRPPPTTLTDSQPNRNAIGAAATISAASHNARYSSSINIGVAGDDLDAAMFPFLLLVRACAEILRPSRRGDNPARSALPVVEGLLRGVSSV